MARKVQVILSDDLDENLTADETVSFALDGTNYEIDLAKKNARELREVFSRYVSAARKVGRAGRASGGGRSRATGGRGAGGGGGPPASPRRSWGPGGGGRDPRRGPPQRARRERSRSHPGQRRFR